MDRMLGVYTNVWPGSTEYSGILRCHSRSATLNSDTGQV